MTSLVLKHEKNDNKKVVTRLIAKMMFGNLSVDVAPALGLLIVTCFTVWSFNAITAYFQPIHATYLIPPNLVVELETSDEETDEGEEEEETFQDTSPTSPLITDEDINIKPIKPIKPIIETFEHILEARKESELSFEHINLHHEPEPDSDSVSATLKTSKATFFVGGDYDPTEDEPLLYVDNSRFVLFPIKHHDLFVFYKEAEASIWTAEEIDLSKDEFDKLKEGEQHFLKHVLAFFAASDGIVNENLALNFSSEIGYAEARAFYAVQIFIETIHSETYSLLIDTYIKSSAERDYLFNAIDTIPAVARKAVWAQQYIDRTSAPFAVRLAAFACVEGIFFSGAFASIFYMRKEGKLSGLGLSNQFISRDEGLHCKFAAHLYQHHVVHKPDPSIITAMVKEAVDIEQQFWVDALDVALIGMNSELMSQYIEFVGDYLLVLLGLPKFYHTPNPFPFMDSFSLESKTNFFESRVDAYSKARVRDHCTAQKKADSAIGSSASSGATTDDDFNMNADF